MKIHQLKLHDFMVFQDVDVRFSPNINIIWARMVLERQLCLRSSIRLQKVAMSRKSREKKLPKRSLRVFWYRSCKVYFGPIKIVLAA